MVDAQGLKANSKIFLLISILTGVFIGAGYLLGGTGGMIIGLGLAAVMNLASYWYSDKLVLKMYNADEVSQETDPELHEMVEKLSQNAGIPKPRVFRSSMQVPNAFATGRNPENGVVCVTEGLMNSLDSEEIEGVIAHELAHIKNRDTLTNTAVATIAGALGFLAEMAFWGAMFGGREEEGELVSALALMIVTPLIATVIKTAVSRSMEYRADADAVRIHGQKQGLSSALKKINKANSGPQRGHVNRSQEAGANLFIENPFASERITKWFSTHPALDDRLENIQKAEI